jgi:hypothetical protein
MKVLLYLYIFFNEKTRMMNFFFFFFWDIYAYFFFSNKKIGKDLEIIFSENLTKVFLFGGK